MIYCRPLAACSQCWELLHPFAHHIIIVVIIIIIIIIIFVVVIM